MLTLYFQFIAGESIPVSPARTDHDDDGPNDRELFQQYFAGSRLLDYLIP